MIRKYRMDSEAFKTFIKFQRLTPFMAVSYFLIAGLISGDFKPFLVFMGIFISMFITSVASDNEFIKNKIYTDATGGSFATDKIIAMIQKNNLFSNSNFSNVPLSTNIFAFLLGYFIYILSAPKTKESQKSKWNSNWMLILFLLLLLLFDGIYIYASGMNLVGWALPFGIGITFGILWAVTIGKSNWMVPKPVSGATCNPSDMKYSCKLSTSGTLIK